MKRWVLIVLLMAGAAALFAAEKAARPAESPVVVELFTSQGCSSCPPADAILRDMVADPAMRGRVIPLAFHVDYWNRLGWRDPFSSRQWSMRQFEYIGAFELKGAYTPQVVINGSRQMIGSSAGEIHRAIAEEARRPPEGTVSVRVDGGEVVVRGQSPRADVDLLLVVYEHGATTEIKSGENKGKTVTDDAIVRQLVRVGTFTGKGVIEERVAVQLGARMGVAALLQDGPSRKILAAAAK